MKELSEDSKVTLSLKTLGIIIGSIAGVVGFWYALQGQIEEAKVTPKPGTGIYFVDPADPRAKESWPPSRQEFDMKDQMSRQEFMLFKEETNKRLEKLEQ
jgi:hypothetical protein